RLLSLDPLAASWLLARLSTEADAVAANAAGAAARVATEGLDALPSASSPLLDITAEQHAAWTVRLFAS
ncbi:urease accessory protein UreF, partial [Streptomyces sp. Wh19]|nr:urease accessory protein UreF [Streptomyces sp. Wh19]